MKDECSTKDTVGLKKKITSNQQFLIRSPCGRRSIYPIYIKRDKEGNSCWFFGTRNVYLFTFFWYLLFLFRLIDPWTPCSVSYHHSRDPNKNTVYSVWTSTSSSVRLLRLSIFVTKLFSDERDWLPILSTTDCSVLRKSVIEEVMSTYGIFFDIGVGFVTVVFGSQLGSEDGNTPTVFRMFVKTISPQSLPFIHVS